METKNADLTGRLLGQLQSLLQLGSSGGVRPLQLSGGGTGFQINDPTVAPRPVEIAQQGDKFVIGYGANTAEQSLAPASKLSDAPAFSTARSQVSSLGTDLFLDFPSVFALAESGGAKSDPQIPAGQAVPGLAELPRHRLGHQGRPGRVQGRTRHQVVHGAGSGSSVRERSRARR